MPSAREEDFRRIFKDSGFPPFKSIFVGDDDMPVLLEADYKMAEVNALARMANDPVMLGILNDPKRDIHSEMAVKAFSLPWNEDRMRPLNILMKDWMSGITSPMAGKVLELEEFPDLNGGSVLLVAKDGSLKKVPIWPGHKVAVDIGKMVKEGQLLSTSYKSRRTAGKTVIFGENRFRIDSQPLYA